METLTVGPDPARGTRRFFHVIWLLVVLVFPGPGSAQYDPADATLRTLGDEVQGLRREVLDIHRELLLLEDEMLYPEPARLIVFLSSSPDADLSLQSLNVMLDGSVVGRHQFDDEEALSLRAAGVHRAYIGIVQRGEHRIEIELRARGDDGEDLNPRAEVEFTKGASPLYFEFRVAPSSERNAATIEINQW